MKVFNNLVIVAFLVFTVFLFTPQVFAQETPSLTQPVPNEPVQPQSPQPNQPQQPMTPQQEQPRPAFAAKGDQNEPREFVAPREIKDVLRQIKDIKREANRLIKKAQKVNLADEVAKLNEILSQVVDLETKLKNASPESIDREVLQDFYDSQAWDKLNDIRVKIELPNEIKMIEREIKKLEKMISKKTFVIEGVDIEKVKAKIGAIKSAVEQAKSNLAQGNLEDARESLQLVYEEGAHPGEMMGVLNRLFEITRQLKKFKSEEIRNEVMDILKPVFEAVASDDYREANMLLNEIDRDLWRILNTAKSKSTMSNDLKKRVQQLEEKLQLKAQEQQKDLKDIKNEKQSYYNGQQRASSFLGNILSIFLNWLDF